MMTNNESSSNSRAPRTYGITSPLSLEGPSEKDEILTSDLQGMSHTVWRHHLSLLWLIGYDSEAIEPYGAFDTHDGLSHRIQVLTKLNELVKQFVKKVAAEKQIPTHLHDGLGGKIYTFGSYRLGNIY